MKRFVSAVLITLLLSRCTYSIKRYDEYERGSVVTLSEKVGELIDAEERKQYGLFWGIVGFQSAVVYDIIEGGYVLEVVTKNDNYVVINRDPQGLDILRDYMDRHEEVKQSTEDFKKKWKILDYDKTGLAITEGEVNSVKGLGFTIGCATIGTVSTIALGAYFLLALGVAVSLSHRDQNLTGFTVILVVGLITGIAGSIMSGAQADRAHAISRIKEARKPRAIE